MKMQRSAPLVILLSMMIGGTVYANADRFNSIKSGMNRTTSVTGQNDNSAPNQGEWKDAVDDANDNWSGSYDDSEVMSRILKLEQDSATVGYVDSRDNAFYSSAKSYADSAASGAEARSKSHAESKANTAENNAKAYANTIATNKANTAESNSKSFASSAASGAEQNAKSFAMSQDNELKASQVAFESRMRDEISKLWAAIREQDTGGGGDLGWHEWLNVTGGTVDISVPAGNHDEYRVFFEYEYRISPHHSYTLQSRDVRLFPGETFGVAVTDSCGGNTARISSPAVEAGTSFTLPTWAEESVSVCGQGTVGQASIRNFRVTRALFYGYN